MKGREPEKNKNETSEDNIGEKKTEKKTVGHFLDYRTYRSTTDPDGTTLVLVYFSDCIVNRKATELGFKTAL